jgi:hypothetical protein
LSFTVTYTPTVVDGEAQGAQEVYVHGLGTFKAGVPTAVTDEQAGLFRTINATQDHEIDDKGGVKPIGKLGPTIEDFLKNTGIFTCTVDGEGGGKDEGKEEENKDGLDDATRAQMQADLAENKAKVPGATATNKPEGSAS